MRVGIRRQGEEGSGGERRKETGRGYEGIREGRREEEVGIGWSL
ncbi:MAG: hypothetical protein SOX94_04005 [Prevotella sp.]|nr:hypothetical protein [Prevotella sp.]